MKMAFTDSHYWIAVTNPHDSYHAGAKAASKALGTVLLVTTEEVLTEFLNYYSKRGEHLRLAASNIVRGIRKNANVRVLPQTSLSFEAGHALYDQRQDQRFSLTDCISMAQMRKEGITEILTNDSDFEHEGFTVLIKK